MVGLDIVLRRRGFKINQYVKIFALVSNMNKIYLIFVLTFVSWIEILSHFLKRIYMKLDQMVKIWVVVKNKE